MNEVDAKIRRTDEMEVAYLAARTRNSDGWKQGIDAVLAIVERDLAWPTKPVFVITDEVCEAHRNAPIPPGWRGHGMRRSEIRAAAEAAGFQVIEK